MNNLKKKKKSLEAENFLWLQADSGRGSQEDLKHGRELSHCCWMGGNGKCEKECGEPLVAKTNPQLETGAPQSHNHRELNSANY